ncbi:MAG: hypothetical protein ACM3RX_04335 [Methanococcaceae archaeon]
MEIEMLNNLFQIILDLIRTPSPSKKEEVLAKHIVINYSGDDWLAKKDRVHNIYFRRNNDDESRKLPLLVAHIDTHPNGDSPENNNLLEEDDIITLINGQICKSHKIQMGFDDKAGVAAILYLMKYTNLQFRALLVTQEESTNQPNYGRRGGGGIDYALKGKFRGIFKNVSYVFSLDRKEGRDIIDKYGKGSHDQQRIRLCSEEFREWIKECSIQIGYPMEVSEKGRIGDVYNIRSNHRDLNCVNLSIGYRNEHTNEESLCIDETIGVIKVVQKCLSN